MALRDSRNVTVEGAVVAPGTEVFLRVDGEASGGIRVSGVETRNAKKPVDTGAGVRPDAVVLK